MRSSKFTMIELLITMAVIAILAGMIMGGAMLVRNKGAETETQSRITALKQAIVAYEAEYGALPCSFLSTEVWSADLSSDSNATYDKLIETLCLQNAGQGEAGCSENVRKIQFLKPMGEPGKPYTDAWELRFKVKLDVGGVSGATAYDNQIKDPDTATQRARVLIYSLGQDMEEDNGRIKSDVKQSSTDKCDDLRSW